MVPKLVEFSKQKVITAGDFNFFLSWHATIFCNNMDIEWETL